MKLKLFSTAVLLAFVAVAMATTDSLDIIYLKNGSIIKGRMISPATPAKIKVELAGGSIFVFDQAEVDSFKKESLHKSQLADIKNNYYRKNSGYRNITELAIIYGVNFKNNPSNNAGIYYDYYYSSNPDDIGISLQTVNGYQFCPYFFMGAGVGIDRFITYQQTFSPFFLRLSSEFLKRKVTPYIYADAGYSVFWKQPRQTDVVVLQNVGGGYVAAGGGVRIYTRSRASVLLSAGYKMNMSHTRWTYSGYDADIYDIKRLYQRFVMNIGFTF